MTSIESINKLIAVLAPSLEKIVDRKIKKALANSPKTTSLTATYNGKDSQGIEQVIFEGAMTPTPIHMSTVEATLGDKVSVDIKNGRSVINANLSNPSAGIIGVQEASKTAKVAKADAAKAIDYASQAQASSTEAKASAAIATRYANVSYDAARDALSSANNAQADAIVANEAANRAVADAAVANESAAAAMDSAESAQSSASAATRHLSDVERVVGTVNWIAEHGSYLLTADPAPVDGKAYYTLSGGTYALTEDTAIDAHKQYYESDGEGGYVPVASPVAADIGSYYERSGMTVTRVDDPQASSMGSYFNAYINESVQNLVDTHVWVDSNGLNIASENDTTDGKTVRTGWRIGSVFELMRNSVSWFKLWVENNVAKLRLGRADSGHLLLDDAGLEVMTDASASVAKFGSTTRIGDASNGNYALIDDDSFDIYHGSTQMTHFGFGEGNTGSGTAGAPYYTLGTRMLPIGRYSPTSTYTVGDMVYYGDNVAYICIVAITTAEAWNPNHWKVTHGNYSVAEGVTTVASGFASHAEGYSTKAIGTNSHSEGYETRSAGQSSHSEGQNTLASAIGTHAEGYKTTASETGAHSEGFSNLGQNIIASALGAHAEGCALDGDIYASGRGSHAEGIDTTASGEGSHAEGVATEAEGFYSHAQNRGTIAASTNQTALGKYNVEDANGTYAAIIGNGTADNARSNALAVRWNGLVDQAGETAYPTFIRSSWSTSSDESTLPVTPCFVLSTGDGALYWCDRN